MVEHQHCNNEDHPIRVDISPPVLVTLRPDVEYIPASMPGSAPKKQFLFLLLSCAILPCLLLQAALPLRQAGLHARDHSCCAVHRLGRHPAPVQKARTRALSMKGQLFVKHEDPKRHSSSHSTAEELSATSLLRVINGQSSPVGRLLCRRCTAVRRALRRRDLRAVPRWALRFHVVWHHADHLVLEQTRRPPRLQDTARMVR